MGGFAYAHRQRAISGARFKAHRRDVERAEDDIADKALQDEAQQRRTVCTYVGAARADLQQHAGTEDRGRLSYERIEVFCHVLLSTILCGGGRRGHKHKFTGHVDGDGIHTP